MLLLVLACSTEPTPANNGPTTSTAPIPTPAPFPVPTTDCAPEGTAACPIWIAATPFVDRRDTATSPSDGFDRYACALDVDESGPEFVYAITVSTPQILAVSVESDAGVDIDVHLLGAPDEAACLTRDHLATAWYVQPGTWYLTADSWVDAGGTPQSGGYALTVVTWDFSGTACAMDPVDLEMFWPACAPGIDCSDAAEYPVAHTPSVGPIVLEAHLVTVDEDFPGSGWPNSFTDEIDRHYALSEAESGYAMNRDQPWAPAGEGGSEFGQGSTGAPLPVADESWYVNMYWRDRPASGTRMLVINPFTGEAVGVSAGWETGPGDEAELGGACEEIHDALGTSHESKLLFGFPADPSLPLGPLDCGLGAS